MQGQHALSIARGFLGTGEWADSVWQAQQSIELVVKALMLRTCGISESERKTHDLVMLMKKIHKESGRAWPVLPAALSSVSNAYIRARYPEKGAGRAPFERYDEQDAQSGIVVATNVTEWAISQYDLQVLGQNVKVEAEKERNMRRRTKLNLQPAPVPSAPLPRIEDQPVARLSGQLPRDRAPLPPFNQPAPLLPPPPPLRASQDIGTDGFLQVEA